MMTKALFLDRDGIVNVDHGYVYKIEDFEFAEGIFDLVKLFSNEGYLIFVVTNQSGIGRGYYTEEEFMTLTQWMLDSFAQEEIHIEKVYHCPHSPEAKCHCRKPETGMIEEVMKAYNIDLSHSWMIGDKQSDMDLAANAGIKNAIYIGNNRNMINVTLSFSSLSEAKCYLQENKGKIHNKFL
jgi:D-glycero-D-manno-heptose 1,7-bisphosphate phosphatase